MEALVKTPRYPHLSGSLAASSGDLSVFSILDSRLLRLKLDLETEVVWVVY